MEESFKISSCITRPIRVILARMASDPAWQGLGESWVDGPLVAWNAARFIITNSQKEMKSSKWNPLWYKT